LFIIKKINKKKHFLINKKINLILKKIFFPFILDEKYFSKVMKKLKISYYMLIILILVLKLLIAIYFILNFFLFYFLEFDLI